MNIVEVETNVKFMIKLVWKTEDVSSAFGKVYEDNSPLQTSTIYEWITRFNDEPDRVEDGELIINISF